jgi:WD40 repeat protein
VGLPAPALRITGHPRQISWLGFSSDSRRVYSADRGGVAKVWDTAPPAPPFALKAEDKRDPWNFRLVSPDASRLAVLAPAAPADAKAELVIYDAAGRRLCRLEQVAPDLTQVSGFIRYSLAFSADGRRLATHGLAAGKAIVDLNVFDTATGKKLVTIKQDDLCHNPTFSPDGRLLVAAVQAPPPPSARPGVNPNGVRGFKIWDAVTGKPLQAVEAAVEGRPAFSPDGRFLAWVVKTDPQKRNADVRLWDTTTGQEIPSMRKGFEEALGQIAFSPDGRTCAVLITRFAVFGRESEVKVWDAATGEERVTLVGTFLQFTFSPDGRRIATNGGLTNGERGEVKVWDTATGRELLTLRTTGRRSAILFSPDGNRLLAVSDRHNDPGELVQVWDATPVPEPPGARERP